MDDPWRLALLGAAAVHLGFQASVTMVVYPTLFTASRSEWPRLHRVHAKRITPLVIAVYAAALTCSIGAVVRHPGPATAVAMAATTAAVALTMGVAGPAHRALGQGLDPAMVARLRRADLARLAAAAGAAGAALLAAG